MRIEKGLHKVAIRNTIVTDETAFKKILSNKSIIINILWYKLKDTEANSWESTQQGLKRRTMDKVPFNELMTYGDAFLFEIGSFLDTLIKFICGKSLKDKVYFDKKTLSKIQPKDDFIDFLIRCYGQGLSNSTVFNLEKLKEYRNAVIHATILDISKYMMWKAGDGIPKLERNFYILPDNPCDDFSNYTYNQRIALFGFLEEMSKIFNAIVNEINKTGLYNKYVIS